MKKTTVLELSIGHKMAYEDLLSKMATAMFCDCATNTTTNNWCFSEEDIKELLVDYMVETELNTKDLMQDLVDVLQDQFQNQVCECTLLDNQINGLEIDITLWDSFCVNYVDEEACFCDND